VLNGYGTWPHAPPSAWLPLDAPAEVWTKAETQVCKHGLASADQ
jgi:hypothetical protein